MNRKERFIQSQCDRCGKATPAKQNGVGDLFTLPEEYGEPLMNEGSFCQRCIDRYDADNWLRWLSVRESIRISRETWRTDDRELY